MTDTIPDGIWPPHEAFYLESMLQCTTAALRAADDVRHALNTGSEHAPSSAEWQECALTIVDGVQALVGQAAAISRYFWPARPKESHLSRAERLRAGLGVCNDSPLRNRELRNLLEHFDERLDEFCRRLLAGAILPTYVGPMHVEPEVPTHFFRAYYTDIGVFEILGERFEIQPFVDELHAVHGRLLQCAQAGGRIPKARKG